MFINRLISRTLAGLVLLACSPLFLVFTIGLWTTQQSPIFERVWLARVGHEVWQFRTEFRSPMGRWMRKWSLDQWPALWTVFCGQIDLFPLVEACRKRHR